MKKSGRRIKQRQEDQMEKDWTGHGKSIFACQGASNHSEEEREANDYYATDPYVLKKLLEVETFNNNIWEPACGAGHLSMVLEEHNYKVKNSDIVYRGYPGTEIIDFLSIHKEDLNGAQMDIITNPPYKYAKEFVEKALGISNNGTKIAMFLKLTFLEGQKRRKLFDVAPPKIVYVFSKRVICAKNGEFEKVKGSAVSYAWFIWEKGFAGDPIIKWI